MLPPASPSPPPPSLKLAVCFVGLLRTLPGLSRHMRENLLSGGLADDTSRADGFVVAELDNLSSASVGSRAFQKGVSMMLDALRPVRTVLYTPEEPAVCGRNCSQPSRGPLEWRGQNVTVRHSRSLNSAAHLGKGETALQCRLRTFGASAYYGAWSKAHAAYQLVREHEELSLIHI